MTDIAALVADNLHIWSGAIERKSGAGRGSGKRINLYGIDRLRALSLDLAVRGKLVPQDTADEPASELLKKIKNEKSRLVASGKAKHGKSLAAPSEWPFEIPGTWSWSQLGHVTNYGQTEKVDPDSVSPETWVLELEDVEKSTSHLLERVRYAHKPFQSQKNAFQIGDVIYGKLRPYLDKVIIADEPGVCTTEMVPMRGYAGLRPDYIRLFLKSPFFITLATEAAHGMNLPRLATEKAREAPFALPPLAEQQRIVTKVNELMALCDTLERESADAMAAHQALVEALLATLVNSTDAADLARQWARLESHFDTLFTTDASMEALKQTILDLAVRGILVAGLETNETSRSTVALASKAKRAMSEAEGLRTRAPVARGKLARPEDSFPSRWTFTEFDSVFVTVSGVTKGQKIARSEAIDAPYLRVANVQRGQLDLGEMKTITVKHSDFERYQLRNGDVLMTEGGDWDKLGRAAIWRNEVPNCIHQNHVFRVRFEQKAILPEWVVLFVNSPLGREFFSRAAKQTTNLASINMTQLRSCPIPIPAYAEQRRIVANVDALMALCDALKSRLADAAQTQRHLADAITERAAA